MSAELAATFEAEPGFADALDLCVRSLSKLADYQLDESLERRLFELGERKENLDAAEHDELLSLVSFAEKRTEEKLQAQLALSRLREFVPAKAAAS